MSLSKHIQITMCDSSPTFVTHMMMNGIHVMNKKVKWPLCEIELQFVFLSGKKLHVNNVSNKLFD